MKTTSLIFMGIAFLMALLSAIMYWGQGFHAWIWQVITMVWIANSFIYLLRIERLLKLIKKITS
jgi:hypothetical protein